MPLKCEFHDVGCKESVLRQDLASHHSEKARHHASLVVAATVENKKWEEINLEWEIAPRIANEMNVTVDSPYCTANGVRFQFRLHIIAGIVEIELLKAHVTSNLQRSKVQVKCEKIAIDVWLRQTNEWAAGRAESLEKGEEDDDVTTFWGNKVSSGRCPFLVERGDEKIKVSNSMLQDPDNEVEWIDFRATIKVKRPTLSMRTF